MVKHTFILSLFISALISGCVTSQPAIQTCHDLVTIPTNSFIGQGYGNSYEIAMNNAQAELSNNISSTIKSKIIQEMSKINDVVQSRFQSKSELTSGNVPIDGYELLDTCEKNNEYRISLALSKAGYQITLKQKLIQKITIIEDLIAKMQTQDAYYKRESAKALRISYQDLIHLKYLSNIYGANLSDKDKRKLQNIEHSAKKTLNAKTNDFVAVKYSNDSLFVKGIFERSLGEAGIKFTNVKSKSYVYLDVNVMVSPRKVGSQYVSKLQLELTVKKSQNNDILHSQIIGTGIGYSQTSQNLSIQAAQRKLKSALDHFVENRFVQLIKELKI